MNSLLESDKGSEDEASLVGDEDYSIVPAFVSLSNEVLLSTCNSNFQVHYFDELHVQSDQD